MLEDTNSLDSAHMRKLKLLDSHYSWAGRFESYLVANPEDRFSRDEAHIFPKQEIEEIIKTKYSIHLEFKLKN